MDHAKPLLGNSCFTIAIHLKLVVLWILQVFFSSTWDLENEPGMESWQAARYSPGYRSMSTFLFVDVSQLLRVFACSIFGQTNPNHKGFAMHHLPLAWNDDHLGGSEFSTLVVGWFVVRFLFKNRSLSGVLKGSLHGTYIGGNQSWCKSVVIFRNLPWKMHCLWVAVIEWPLFYHKYHPKSRGFWCQETLQANQRNPTKTGEKKRHTLRSARFLNPW